MSNGLHLLSDHLAAEYDDVTQNIPIGDTHSTIQRKEAEN